MIESITIEGLRGIHRGRLERLGALTILTGVNGCGKSTILDALLIGCHGKPGDAVGHAVQRHRASWGGARWLVRSGNERARVVVKVIEARVEREIERKLTWGRDPSSRDSEVELVERGHSGPFSCISLDDMRSSHDLIGGQASVVFAMDNAWVATREGSVTSDLAVRLVDPGRPSELHRAYSEAIRQGRREDVHTILRAVVDGFSALDILSEDDNTPAVYIVPHQGGAVPVALSGDGVYALAQMAVELAASPGGLVLVEEPEAYQHPAALVQTARVLLATMRRGVQLVITTHSLELIDAIVRESTNDDLSRTALFTLRLEGGVLASPRIEGKDIALARSDVEMDLR
jgi:predicted ATPase